MKNYLKLMVTSLFVIGLASCTDFDEQRELTFEEIQVLLNQELIKREAEFGPMQIEIITLEEYNTVMVENGLPELTQQDFTPDQWETLHSGEIISHTRCATSYGLFYGDWNANGVFSAQDLVLAQLLINFQGGSFNWQTAGFPLFPVGAMAHWTHLNGESFHWILSRRDLDIGALVILGLLPGC